ncbi:MAG: mraZ [Puniceicoccaceae bacterium]|nr:MAG: mraZ [Puniceicoccaceae bacterium]
MTTQAKPFFVGSYRHNLDAKNRLTIPSKWRFAGDEEMDSLGIPHPGGYISILPPAEVEKLYERASEKALSDDEGQALLQKLFSQAHPVRCDKQGRINLSETLLAHAGIERETVLVGTMNKFAIYSPERWAPVDPAASGENLGSLMKKVGL